MSWQEIRGVIVILSHFGRLWSKSSAGILNSYSKDINRGYQGPVSSSVFCGPDFCFEYGARLTVCQAYQGSFRPRIHLKRNRSTDVVWQPPLLIIGEQLTDFYKQRISKRYFKNFSISELVEHTIFSSMNSLIGCHSILSGVIGG